MKNIDERAHALFQEACVAEDDGNISAAISKYLEAIALGFTPAMTNLGNLFDDVCVPRRKQEAVQLYKRALDAGDSVGAYCLAIHYKNLSNFEQYEHWLAVASDLGNQDALVELNSRRHNNISFLR